MISYIIIGVLALIVSCGNMRDPERVPEAFAGDWSGTVHVSIPPEIVRDYPATIPVSVIGREAVLSGLCPDGSGTLVLGGFDGTIAWQGSVKCESSWILGCAVALEYTSASAWVDETGNLQLHAQGNAHRAPLTDMTCEGYVSFTMQFAGVKTRP